MNSNIKEIEYVKYVTNKKFEIIEIDEKFTKLTGYTKEDIKNNKLTQKDLIFEEDYDDYVSLVYEKITKDKEAYIEHRIKRKDGTGIFVFCFGTIGINKDNEIEHIIRVIDMSKSLLIKDKEKKYNKKIKNLKEEKNIDDLTSLLNRDAFLSKINKLLKNPENSYFIMFDLDDFKNINDTFGHLMGDFILKEIGKVFNNYTKNNGYACRFGGDEFGILVSDIKDINEYLDNIISDIESIKIMQDENYKITMSIGALKLNEKYSNFEEIYDVCDKLLYKSKENGKNRYTIVNE